MCGLKVGVLALQGAFAKHVAMMRSLDVEAKEVRTPSELADCDALIIPGGESTTMMRQIDFIKMADELCSFAKEKPLFGTCAGLILMAKEIVADKMIPFGILDIAVERNAFGRQAESFIANIDLNFEGRGQKHFPAVFIRAPRIHHYGSDVKVLGSYQNEPVFVQEGMHLGSTFHPELTHDLSLHRYFLSIVKDVKKNKKTKSP